MKNLQVHPKRSQGAFLIISMILLVVLSAVGVAIMSMVYTSNRASHNYSDYMQAKTKAISMANYGKRILEEYPDNTFPGPGRCTSTADCNVVPSSPYQHVSTQTVHGEHSPDLMVAWPNTLDAAPTQHAQNDTWWTDNGLAFEDTFDGSGNAVVTIEWLGADSSAPFNHTYRIIGYATDNNGKIKAKHELYHTWEAEGTGSYTGIDISAYSTSNNTTYTNTLHDCDALNPCPWGFCCSTAGYCDIDEAHCSTSYLSATVPPGWTCTEWFITKHGAQIVTTTSVCTNPVTIP